MPAGSEDAGARKVIRPTLDVAAFLAEAPAELSLELVAGRDGLSNRIELDRIQKFGLALTGFTRQVRPGRVQIFGETEVSFAEGLGTDQRREVFAAACRVPVAAFLVTKGLEPPAELLEVADLHRVPVLRSPARSSAVIDQVQRFLQERLAARVRIHGVLLEVFGLGVLLLGDSGIGKSECALDLVQRGHRLVADDVVEIRGMSSQLVGTSSEQLRHHMELRGIGVINIKDMFGVAAVRERKFVELVVRLVRWQEGADYERLGCEERHYDLLGRSLPYLEMPVAPGRHLSILVEVAARNQMLKAQGYHPARALVERLDAAVLARGEGRKP